MDSQSPPRTPASPEWKAAVQQRDHLPKGRTAIPCRQLSPHCRVPGTREVGSARHPFRFRLLRSGNDLPFRRLPERREPDDAGVRQAEAVGVEAVVDAGDGVPARVPRTQGGRGDRADDFIIVVLRPGRERAGAVGGGEVVGQVPARVRRFREHGAAGPADPCHGRGEAVRFRGAVPVGDRSAGCMGTVMRPPSPTRTLTRAWPPAPGVPLAGAGPSLKVGACDRSYGNSWFRTFGQGGVPVAVVASPAAVIASPFPSTMRSAVHIVPPALRCLVGVRKAHAEPRRVRSGRQAVGPAVAEVPVAARCSPWRPWTRLRP